MPYLGMVLVFEKKQTTFNKPGRNTRLVWKESLNSDRQFSSQHSPCWLINTLWIQPYLLKYLRNVRGFSSFSGRSIGTNIKGFLDVWIQFQFRHSPLKVSRFENSSPRPHVVVVAVAARRHGHPRWGRSGRSGIHGLPSVEQCQTIPQLIFLGE